MSATHISAFAVMFAFASANFAQMVGGYRAIAITDAGAVAAADFAVDAQSEKTDMEIELGEIVKAERQVVAGSNYRLCMDVSAEGEAFGFVQAVVYVDLKNNRKLSSWVNSTCGNAAKTGTTVKGFKPVDKDDAGAGLAADFAVRTQSKKTKSTITLDEIVNVQDQEPGMMSRNFRLCMKVNTNGKPSSVLAAVSMDEYSNLKLLSWAAATCGGPAKSADGFDQVEKNDVGVATAADFAIGEQSKKSKIQYKLGEILKAENKGLFSMTYRACMSVTAGGKSSVVQAVVTMDQYTNYKLVSWVVSNCGN